MSILKNFYQAKPPVEISAGCFVCRVTLNPEHEIFKGHFPDNPVTPGVCMMQIVKDLSEQITNEKLFLSLASNVKFMAIINPFVHPQIDITIEITRPNEGEIKVKSTTMMGETTALKMSLQYKILQ